MFELVRCEMEKEKKRKGLKDHGKICINCADCGTQLMEFWITQTNDELTEKGQESLSNKILVRCGICGGKSYIHTIEGYFHAGVPHDNMGFEPLDEKSDDCDHIFKAWKS